MPRLALLLAALVVSLPLSAQQPTKKDREPTATAPDQLKVAKDFKVELLYSVPRDKEGSWVNLCVDPKGRLYVSDQYGLGLFRVTPPPLGGKPSDTKVEHVPVTVEGKKGKEPLGDAQGLLWAFDSLYVMVNSNRIPSGLYRVRDTNGDDVLDEVKHLRKFDGGNREHATHAVLLSPDGKSLTIVNGNQEALTKFDTTRVPRHWGEDHLLPRMPDGRGFMAGVMGPGGAIYKTDPGGEDWELICVGFRNEYDAAYNRNGDLFTYDADMEWDFNTPWYRPTRVNLCASGAEFGWRNGSGKWPAYYPDSLPAVVDVGPGSPTGVCFGYEAKFPAKYQDAFYICDWSYGKLYAIHLTPSGSAYTGEIEEFVTGNPLPLTDVVVNPVDGAMYFAIGGRRVTSGLYRVTYTGKESTAASKADDRGADARALRRKLEAFHGKQDPKAVETAWPYLAHADRYIRYAARTAVEHQDAATWRDKALSEKDPYTAVGALLALVRVSSSDPAHRKKVAEEPKEQREAAQKLKSRVLDALDRIPWDKLTDEQRIDLLRVYGIAFNRMGKPAEDARKRAVAALNPHYPSKHRFLNAELCQVLVYLEAPKMVEKTLKLLEAAPTQEEQMEYAKSLRVLKTGWTPEQRKTYFTWFQKAAHFKGGNSFDGFLKNIRSDAVKRLTEEELVALKPILETKIDKVPVVSGPPRPLVKQWKMDDLAPLVEKGLTGRDFDNGRKMFGVATCFACHRFTNEGGAHGPDLTGSAGRYSPRDLLEAIVEPSKVIPDQYAAVRIEQSTGKTVVGRIINLHNDNITVMPDMMDPNALVTVDRRKVESVTPSTVSLMPTGLVDTLNKDEILDLMAYVLSRGNPEDKMFRPNKPASR